MPSALTQKCLYGHERLPALAEKGLPKLLAIGGGKISGSETLRRYEDGEKETSRTLLVKMS